MVGSTGDAGKARRGWSSCPGRFPCSVSSDPDGLFGFVSKSLLQDFQPFSKCSLQSVLYKQRKTAGEIHCRVMF